MIWLQLPSARQSCRTHHIRIADFTAFLVGMTHDSTKAEGQVCLAHHHQPGQHLAQGRSSGRTPEGHCWFILTARRSSAKLRVHGREWTGCGRKLSLAAETWTRSFTSLSRRFLTSVKQGWHQHLPQKIVVRVKRVYEQGRLNMLPGTW